MTRRAQRAAKGKRSDVAKLMRAHRASGGDLRQRQTAKRGGRSTRAKKFERKRDEPPSALIEAALAIFAKRGFAATRLDEVAAAAGVTKGTIYLYFDSKAHLFEAVLRQGLSPRIDAAQWMIDAFDGTSAELVATLMQLFAQVLDTEFPAVVKIIVAESANFPILAKIWIELVVSRILALTTRVVVRGVKRGEFRAVNPAHVAPLVVGPMFLLALWKQSYLRELGISFDVSAVLGEHGRTLVHGLAKPQPPSHRASRA